MAFRFIENRNSRASTHTPPSKTYEYYAMGSGDADFVRTWALLALPETVNHEQGTLFRDNLQVRPRGYQQWVVIVQYTRRKTFEWDFDTTGGTIHISTSLETRNSYGTSTPIDYKQSIDVRPSGDVVGTEKIIPALKINATFTHPPGIVNLGYARTLAGITGTVNSTPFLTFRPGEVLFLGASGSDGADTESRVRYQFAMSENADGLSIGDIVGIAKKGWDYIWIRFEDEETGGYTARVPKWAYVERVYEEIDLAAFLGFGG